MKYHPTFHIVDTEEQAIAFCNRINSQYTAYMRKKHPAHYTPWSSNDGYNGFVVLYQY